MAKKLNEKYNTASLKLLQFLQMLYEGEVEYKTVLEHLSKNPLHITSNTHVTLNKYLNCFKVFGVEVKKIKNKYIMTNPLYKLELDSNDIKSLEMLNKAGNLLPDGKNKKNFDSFLKSVLIRLSEEQQKILVDKFSSKNNIELNINAKQEQIKLYEKYCQDGYKVEIIYFNAEGNELNVIGSPTEIVYVKNEANLKIIGNNGSRIYEIPIDNIKSIKQLPMSSSGMSIPTTVVYVIKGRLAKNYKLRDWEKLQKIEDNGDHVIVNKTEDLDLLINRIMRYGIQCEILSPKFVRIAMAEHINKTLSNYQ